MPALVMVDDPRYKGATPAPQIPRTWAMRRLFEDGMAIGDIARTYGVPYQRAYNAVNSAPPAAAARTPAASAAAAAKSSAVRKPDSAAAHSASDQPADRKKRPGPKPKEHTRAQLKQMTTPQLKAAVKAKDLTLDSQYGQDLAAELDAREPGWWDNL